MAFAFNAEELSRIEEILGQYPDKQSALLPVLHLAQDRNGWISRDVMRVVSDLLELPMIHVEDVVSFYTMYNRSPVGKYHVQICTNISCYLKGSFNLLEYLEDKLGIKSGETDTENRFTLTQVQCLGACGGAPVVQINNEYYEDCTPELLDQILDNLK